MLCCSQRRLRALSTQRKNQRNDLGISFLVFNDPPDSSTFPRGDDTVQRVPIFQYLTDGKLRLGEVVMPTSMVVPGVTGDKTDERFFQAAMVLIGKVHPNGGGGRGDLVAISGSRKKYFGRPRKILSSRESVTMKTTLSARRVASKDFPYHEVQS